MSNEKTTNLQRLVKEVSDAWFRDLLDENTILRAENLALRQALIKAENARIEAAAE